MPDTKPKTLTKRSASKLARFPGLKLSASFSDKLIELPCLEIGFDLLIPHTGIKLEESSPKLGQVLGSQVEDLLLKLFEFAHSSTLRSSSFSIFTVAAMVIPRLQDTLRTVSVG